LPKGSGRTVFKVRHDPGITAAQRRLGRPAFVLRRSGEADPAELSTTASLNKRARRLNVDGSRGRAASLRLPLDVAQIVASNFVKPITTARTLISQTLPA